MKQAQLTKENAQQMIDSGIESSRVFSDSYESITTWEKVCEKLNLDPTDKVILHPAVKTEYIFEAIRGSEQAVFDGETKWYFVWWEMLHNRFLGSHFFNSSSFVSPRLGLQDVIRIDHIIKYFEDDLKKYFIR